MIVGPYSRHELLHTVSVVVNLFDREVSQHPALAVSQHKVRALADSIALMLGCLYQAVGEENCDGLTPEEQGGA